MGRAYNISTMKSIDGMQRLFAVSAYTRAREGDFTSKRRVATSPGEVSSRVIQADAALRGILSSLRAMREICAERASRDMTGEEMAARNGELETHKENISRLSEAIAGVEFLSFARSGADAETELRDIDDAIGRVSRYCESEPESGERRLSDWMRDLLGA